MVVLKRFSGRFFCIVMLALLLLAAVVSASITTVPAGGFVYIGEQGLDITASVPSNGTQIGWWAPPTPFENPPDSNITVFVPGSYFISPTDYATRTGNWYVLPDKTLAFRVLDPLIDLNVRDVINGTDVTGTSVGRGIELRFRITSNLYPITERGIPGAPVSVHVRKPDSTVLVSLMNISGSSNSLIDIPVSTMPYDTLPFWNTGASTYDPGTYIIWADCNVNGMKDNYKLNGTDYTGKTITPAYTVTVTGGSSPGPNTINGTIYYTGTQNATIFVHLFNQTPGPGVPAWKTKTMTYPGYPINYGFSTVNGTFWLMAYMDLNRNYTPDTNEPWGFAINKTNMQGPDPIPVTGNMTGLDITLYEPPTLNATLIIGDIHTVASSEDSLTHGVQPVRIDRGLNIGNNNPGDLVLENVSITADGSHITNAVPMDVTTWNNTHVRWNYTSPVTIPPFNAMDAGWWNTDLMDTVDIPISVNRWVNQSIFTSPGYQLFTYNATFENTTCDWIYGRISSGYGLDNATILIDSFATDAPIRSLHPVTAREFGFDLNMSAVQAHRAYNFSIVISVDPTNAQGRSVEYKPGCSIAEGFGTGFRPGILNSKTATLPSDMLPSAVTNLTVASDIPLNWNYYTNNAKSMQLDPVWWHPPASNPIFQIFDFSTTYTSNDSIIHGIQTVNKNRGLGVWSENSSYQVALSNIVCTVFGLNIQNVYPENHVIWNNSLIQWSYPEPGIYDRNNTLNFYWQTNVTVPWDIPITMNRQVNRSIFAESGYQLLTLNVTYENTTNTNSIYTSIDTGFNQMVMPFNATIVLGTFITDAPIQEYHPVNEHQVGFNVDMSRVEAGKSYNFSIVIFVEPKDAHGQPFEYKPHVDTNMGIDTGYQEGGATTTATMPAGLLPPYVTSATLSTNVSLNWSYASISSVQAGLNEVFRNITPRATFIHQEEWAVDTDGNGRTAGTYQARREGDQGISISFDTNTEIAVEDLSYDLQAENIVSVSDGAYATWNDTNARWVYPGEIVSPEGIRDMHNWKTGDLTPMFNPISVNRSFNTSTFTGSGFQKVTFKAIFDSKDSDWLFGKIKTEKLLNGTVNPTLLPATFTTDAPIDFYDGFSKNEIHCIFNKSLLETGRKYNFSVVINVSTSLPEGQVLTYKPRIKFGMGWLNDSRPGETSATALMPSDMLPPTVHLSRVTTNLTAAWEYRSEFIRTMGLSEVANITEVAAPNASAGLLILPDISIPSGARKAAPIFIANVTNASGIGFDLTYNPAVIHITNLTANTSLTGATLEYEINNSTGSVNVSLTTTSPITTTTAKGIVNINVESKGITGQQCALSTDFGEWTDPEFGAIPLSMRQGTVRIEGIRGDFNHNERVDIGDVTRVAYMSVGLVTDDIQADFNGNEIVDGGDAAKIAWYYVGKVTEL